MISIGPIASCDYYLSEASSEAVGANEQKTLRRNKKAGGYYEGSQKNGDILKRPLTVHGGAASKLGLKPGQTLTPEMFKNLYFGHHPATGKPLADSIPSKAEQDEQQKALNLAEKKFELAQTDRDSEYAAAMKRANNNVSDALKDPKLVEADRVLAAASGELKSAQNAEGHRRAGIDISFSLPPDINLIHSSLLAEGRLKEAKDLEDAFTLAVDEACRDLEKYATASAGRSDRDGIAGEPVKCVWVEATHNDARPDPDSVVSHNHHRHRILLNAGLTEDGRWVAMRTEDIEAQRSRVDGEVLAKMTRYCVVKHNVDPTATEYKKGVLGVEFGGSRALKSLKEKGFTSKLFGRRAQIAKNKAVGMSDSAASRSGRKGKIEGWSAERHIDMQRELLEESGLTLASICGDRKEREREAHHAAEQKLITKFANEEGAWNDYLAQRGFPDGKPNVLKGAEAARWFELMKKISEERKTPAGKDIPPRPARPPGHPEYKEKTWKEAIGREVVSIMRPLKDRLSLEPKKIVEYVSQINPAVTPEALREEISRRIAVQPPKDGLLGAAQRLHEKMMTHEQLNKKVTREIDDIYKKTVKSDLLMESRYNGKTIFVAQDQRQMERELYGEVMPDLLKPDLSVRAMKLEDAKEFIAEREKDQGFPFSTQQRRTLEALATAQVRVNASLGWAGSGKSAQASAAREILNRLGYRVIAVAPSHAAAGVLVKEMGASAGYCPEGLLGAITQGKESLGPNDVVFLDEASMLALRSGSELLAKVRDSGGRLILSGDPKQLQSVGAGNVLNKFIELADEAEAKDGIVRKVLMNEVFTDAQTIQRQKLRVSKQIAAEAETGDMRNFFRTLSARGMVEVAADEKALIAKMSKEYREFIEKDVGKDSETPGLLKEFEAAKRTGDERLIGEIGARLAESLEKTRKAYDNTILLAETNAAVDELAKNARATLKELGLLGKEEVRINGARGKMDVAIGDRLVLRGKIGTKDARGDGDEGAGGFEYNKSTLMTVINIRHMQDGSPILTVRLDGANENGVDTLRIPAERFNELAYGYSRTTHLSQGMSAKNSLSMPSKNTRSELALVAMTRFTENGKIFMVASEIEAIQVAASRQQRKLDALDYDELSQIDLSDAIERTRGRRGEDMEAAVSDAKAGALDAARGAMKKPDGSLSPVASAIKAAAGRDKRTDVEKASRLGVVRMNGRLPKADKDSRSWLAVYSEKLEVFNPETSRMELKNAEFAVAYDPKTGRIEEWPAEALDDKRLTLARRATMGEDVRNAIRDADEPKETDIRGVLVGTGVAPLKNSRDGKPTPWAEIESADGTKTKVWGADVGRAIKQGNFRVGDGIALNGDERVNAEVFGSKPIPGGSGKYAGEIVTPPAEGKSGVIRLADGREARVFDAPEWQGLEAGAKVEVHSKIVERRVWTAKPAEVESAIPLESRHRAWAAAERAIGDDDMFERLQAVGAGTKTISNDSENDAKRRAIRTLKANGEGYASVVDWNANVGTTGRRAWHEAGYLVKDEKGVASASLACMTVLDDGERIFCCVAVQNQRSGDVEGMATRIMAFDKKDLGLAADVAPGTALEILVSDDSNVPVIAGNWGGLPNTVKTTAQDLAEKREALLAKREAEEAATVAAQNAIFDAARKLPPKEIEAILARAENAEKEMADKQQRQKNVGKPKSLGDIKNVADLLTKPKTPLPPVAETVRKLEETAKEREADRTTAQLERGKENENGRKNQPVERSESVEKRERESRTAGVFASLGKGSVWARPGGFGTQRKEPNFPLVGGHALPVLPTLPMGQSGLFSGEPHQGAGDDERAQSDGNGTEQSALPVSGAVGDSVQRNTGAGQKPSEHVRDILAPSGGSHRGGASGSVEVTQGHAAPTRAAASPELEEPIRDAASVKKNEPTLLSEEAVRAGKAEDAKSGAGRFENAAPEQDRVVREAAKAATAKTPLYDHERTAAGVARIREATERRRREVEEKRKETERAKTAEWQRRTNEETLARQRRDAEAAAQLAEKSRLGQRTMRIENLDPDSPDFSKDVRGLLESGVDAHASDKTFTNVYIYANGIGDGKREKVLDYLLQKCPEDNPERMDILIDGGADPEIAIARGYPIEKMLEKHVQRPSVISLYLEKGGEVDDAVAKGADPVELFANMPAWRSDDAMVVAAHCFSTPDELRTAFATPGADGATIEKRGETAEAAGDPSGQEMLYAVKAIRETGGVAAAPARGPSGRAK